MLKEWGKVQKLWVHIVHPSGQLVEGPGDVLWGCVGHKPGLVPLLTKNSAKHKSVKSSNPELSIIMSKVALFPLSTVHCHASPLLSVRMFPCNCSRAESGSPEATALSPTLIDRLHLFPQRQTCIKVSQTSCSVPGDSLASCGSSQLPSCFMDGRDPWRPSSWYPGEIDCLCYPPPIARQS